MNTPIYFSGKTDINQQSQQAFSIDAMFQGFGHFLGTIWVHKNEVPTNTQSLATFDPVSLIPEYKAFIANGGHVPTHRGLTVEETWLTEQLFFREPLIVLLNHEQPPQPTQRVTRKTLLAPGDLIAFIQRAFLDLEDWQDIDQGQKRTFSYTMLVFDGKSGHTVVLLSIDQNTGAFRYFDPWPGRSLLCRENNSAGVAAAPCPSGKRLWLITPNDLKKVIYAVMMPQVHWERLCGNSQNIASSEPEEIESKKFIHPNDAEVRFHTFLELCRKRHLLTTQVMDNLKVLYDTNRLFDISSEGYDTLYYLERIVRESNKTIFELRQIFNQVVSNLANPSLLHQ